MVRTVSSSYSKRGKSGKTARKTKQVQPKPTRARAQEQTGAVIQWNASRRTPDGVQTTNGQTFSLRPETRENIQNGMILRSYGDRTLIGRDGLSFFTGMQSASCEDIFGMNDHISTSPLPGCENSEELFSSDEEKLEEAVASGLDPFIFKADEQSVAEIKAGVDDLNFSIDNFITDIIDKMKFKAYNNSQRTSIIATGPNVAFVEDIGSMKPFYQCFIRSARMLNESLTAQILDLVIHDMICKAIYHALFQGDNFWGVEEKTAMTLEALYKGVQKTEPGFAHRWRSLSISAAFQSKSSVEYDKEVADKISEDLRQIFELVYRSTSPGPSSSTKSVKKNVDPITKNCTKAISKIVHQSRELSLNIQSKMLFSSLKVIILKPNRTGSNKTFVRRHMTSVWDADAKSNYQSMVLGTFAFGLDMVDKGDKRNKVTRILLPTVITDALHKMIQKELKCA